jgi:CRP-like cAMP-binding protein
MELMPNAHFSKGQIIFEEGYPAESLYFICDGVVQVFKRQNNKQIHLDELRKDAVFGEATIIYEEPRFTTTIASDDTWCYEINKNFFKDKIKNIDGNVASIFEDLIDTIRKRTQETFIIESSVGEEGIDSVFAEIARINPNRLDFDSHLNALKSSYTQDYLTNNNELLAIIEKMDLVMRKLYFSLISIAYK